MNKAILIAVFIFASCRSKHDKVDDEYSRGFYNAMAIIQERRLVDIHEWPQWDECKKSYLSRQDLYNYWDTAYLINEFHKHKPMRNEHALGDSVLIEGYYPPFRWEFFPKPSDSMVFIKIKDERTFPSPQK